MASADARAHEGGSSGASGSRVCMGSAWRRGAKYGKRMACCEEKRRRVGRARWACWVRLSWRGFGQHG